MSQWVLTDEEVAIVNELKSIREQSKQLRAREEEIRTRLLERFQDEVADEAVTASGAPLAVLSSTTRSSVNRKKLEAMYPDVFQACVEESTVYQINTNLKAKTGSSF